MNPAVSAIIKGGLLALGWYAARLRRDTFPGVLVLCYHGVRSASWRPTDAAFADLHVDADTFNGHCEVIARTCHPISLDDWRRAATGASSLPDRPVLITFDDGYRSVYDLARPIMQRHGMVGSVFVCSEPIRHRRLFWFDAVARERGLNGVAEIQARADAYDAMTAMAAGSPVDPSDPLAPMSPDQVRALAADGFEIGVHTSTHGRLSAATAAQQRNDLIECRDALVEWTDAPIRSLAYPFGKPGLDYTPETVRIAAELGFDFAFTTRQGFAASREAALERSRIIVLAEVTPAELAHRLAHAWPRS